MYAVQSSLRRRPCHCRHGSEPEWADASVPLLAEARAITTGRELAETARRAESIGIDVLVIPAPIPAMATIAAATNRLRVAAFVMNNDLRHPAVLVQDLASLDVLSDGRSVPRTSGTTSPWRFRSPTHRQLSEGRLEPIGSTEGVLHSNRAGDKAMQIDLNSDLGEGFGIWTLGEDDGLLDVVTSANVACGFHAGDASTMRRVCRRAAERGVRIGAQVGYHDLAGFGRRPMDVPANELTDEVVYQIGALDAFARIADSRVAYVKPHGALYNACVTDQVQAEAVVRAVREIDPSLPVLGLPGSELLRAADAAGLPTVNEAFADRAYDAAGHLVSRRQEGAVISDPKTVVARCLRLVSEGRVTALDGTQVSVTAQSLCLHGDTPGALRLARRVRDGLAEAGVQLAPFC